MVLFQKAGNLDKDVGTEKVVHDCGDEELMSLQVRVHLSSTGCNWTFFVLTAQSQITDSEADYYLGMLG